MPDRRGNRPRPTRNRYGAEGSVWRRIAAHVLARDFGTCHICGHAGATVVDHVLPVTERPDLALDASNMKAAHGYAKSSPGFGACPVCSAASAAKGGKPVYCNETRGAMSLVRARRVLEKRTGLSLANDDEGQPRGERDWLRLAVLGCLPASVR